MGVFNICYPVRLHFGFSISFMSIDLCPVQITALIEQIPHLPYLTNTIASTHTHTHTHHTHTPTNTPPPPHAHTHTHNTLPLLYTQRNTLPVLPPYSYMTFQYFFLRIVYILYC